MTERVMEAKFSQESGKKTFNRLTDTVTHTVCQDSHANKHSARYTQTNADTQTGRHTKANTHTHTPTRE